MILFADHLCSDLLAHFDDGEELSMISVSKFSTDVLCLMTVPIPLLSKAKGTTSATEGSFTRMHSLMVSDVAQLSELCEANRALQNLIVAASKYILFPVFEGCYFLTLLVNAALLYKRIFCSLLFNVFFVYLAVEILNLALCLSVDSGKLSGGTDTVHSSFFHGYHPTSLLFCCKL